MAYTLLHGDCKEQLLSLDDCSVDAVVTDPPYEIGFMGNKWDKGGIAYSLKMWRGVRRVLKPGGHLVSFASTRTVHRIACAIEDAGFEIREMLVWLFAHKQPMGQNLSLAIDRELGKEKERKVVSKARRGQQRNCYNGGWGLDFEKTTGASKEAQAAEGWNTTLKPAFEPIVLARKPISEATVASNMVKHGVGGLNVEACRVPVKGVKDGGRFAASVLLTHAAGCTDAGCVPGCPALEIDKQSGYEMRKPGKGEAYHPSCFADSGGASRFYFCTKASTKERDADNNHPTVKPTQLMEWLVRLITPSKGLVLDPFMGSGTTGIAAIKQGFSFVGIEQDKKWLEVAKRRLSRQPSSLW